MVGISYRMAELLNDIFDMDHLAQMPLARAETPAPRGSDTVWLHVVERDAVLTPAFFSDTHV